MSVSPPADSVTAIVERAPWTHPSASRVLAAAS
jgi:hypothetical protein